MVCDQPGWIGTQKVTRVLSTTSGKLVCKDQSFRAICYGRKILGVSQFPKKEKRHSKNIRLIRFFNSLDQLLLNHKLLEKMSFFASFPQNDSHYLFLKMHFRKLPLGLKKHIYLFIKLFWYVAKQPSLTSYKGWQFIKNVLRSQRSS